MLLDYLMVLDWYVAVHDGNSWYLMVPDWYVTVHDVT